MPEPRKIRKPIKAIPTLTDENLQTPQFDPQQGGSMVPMLPPTDPETLRRLRESRSLYYSPRGVGRAMPVIVRNENPYLGEFTLERDPTRSAPDRGYVPADTGIMSELGELAAELFYRPPNPATAPRRVAVPQDTPQLPAVSRAGMGAPAPAQPARLIRRRRR